MTAARPLAPPREDVSLDQLAAWGRELDLREEVRRAEATLVEARMPAETTPAGRRVGALRLGVLLAAAAAVVGLYVALPLALAARQVLGATLQALSLAGSLVVLAAACVLMVLERTAVTAGRRRAARRRAEVHQLVPRQQSRARHARR